MDSRVKPGHDGKYFVGVYTLAVMTARSGRDRDWPAISNSIVTHSLTLRSLRSGGVTQFEISAAAAPRLRSAGGHAGSMRRFTLKQKGA